MITTEARSIHFPPASILAKREHRRPDISLLRSIIGSVEQIREELKEIGDESTYASGLRVLKTQALLVAELAGQLIERYEADGAE